MNDVHVCDIVLQAQSWVVDHRTARKVDRRISEMAACAPRMASLCLGELTWTLVPIGKALVLRLGLTPRRQAWLFDPLTNGKRQPATLEEEAIAIFEELRDAAVRVTRLAHELIDGKFEPAVASHAAKLLAEVLFKQSNRQWSLTRGNESGQLDFPSVGAFLVEKRPVVMRGVLSMVAMGRIEIVGISGSSNVDSNRRLLLECAQPEAMVASLPPVGTSLRAKVLLHRCPRTHRVVGGTLVSASS